MYVKGTTDFLRELEDAKKSVLDNNYLVSLDVKSLYTSTLNAEGIKAVKESFDKHTSKNVATKVITVFLALILTLTFTFNCKHYLQIKIGTKYAPPHVNINMDHFEQIYVYPFLQGI